MPGGILAPCAAPQLVYDSGSLALKPFLVSGTHSAVLPGTQGTYRHDQNIYCQAFASVWLVAMTAFVLAMDTRAGY